MYCNTRVSVNSLFLYRYRVIDLVNIIVLFPKGVEVKAGEPLKVEPEDGRVVHISQVIINAFTTLV